MLGTNEQCGKQTFIIICTVSKNSVVTVQHQSTGIKMTGFIPKVLISTEINCLLRYFRYTF